MSDRKTGVTVLDDLPEEVIVDKILILLPAKDVGRCRAVCKSWRSATSTPEFMLEHHQRQPSLPIIDNGQAAGFVVLRETGTRKYGQQLWPFIGRMKHGKNRLRAAGDGLLIVSQESRVYICNPTIRKHALLPQPRLEPRSHRASETIRFCGLYRHHPTGEYRVLWISEYFYEPRFYEARLYVLTVGSNMSRHIRIRMPGMLPLSEEEQFLKRLFRFAYCPPVHHCDNLHWTGASREIIVFDTVAESFSLMPCPTQLGSRGRLLDINGTLGFGCRVTKQAMEVWVVQDYQAEIWALKCRIDVSTVEASRDRTIIAKRKNKKKKSLDFTVKSFRDMAVLNERELLIRFNRNYVLRCDIDGKFLGIVNTERRQYHMLLTRYCFQESIIPIPSGEIQEDGEPLFSTGHV